MTESRNERSCPKCGGTGMVMDDRAMGLYMRGQREAVGISCRELARRIKWSASYVSDLELGKRPWNEGKRQRYAKGLR